MSARLSTAPPSMTYKRLVTVRVYTLHLGMMTRDFVQ